MPFNDAMYTGIPNPELMGVDAQSLADLLARLTPEDLARLRAEAQSQVEAARAAGRAMAVPPDPMRAHTAAMADRMVPGAANLTLRRPVTPENVAEIARQKALTEAMRTQPVAPPHHLWASGPAAEVWSPETGVFNRETGEYAEVPRMTYQEMVARNRAALTNPNIKPVAIGPQAVINRFTPSDQGIASDTRAAIAAAQQAGDIPVGQPIPENVVRQAELQARERGRQANAAAKFAARRWRMGDPTPMRNLMMNMAMNSTAGAAPVQEAGEETEEGAPAQPPIPPKPAETPEEERKRRVKENAQGRAAARSVRQGNPVPMMQQMQGQVAQGTDPAVTDMQTYMRRAFMYGPQMAWRMGEIDRENRIRAEDRSERRIERKEAKKMAEQKETTRKEERTEDITRATTIRNEELKREDAKLAKDEERYQADVQRKKEAADEDRKNTKKQQDYQDAVLKLQQAQEARAKLKDEAEAKLREQAMSPGERLKELAKTSPAAAEQVNAQGMREYITTTKTVPDAKLAAEALGTTKAAAVDDVMKKAGTNARQAYLGIRALYDSGKLAPGDAEWLAKYLKHKTPPKMLQGISPAVDGFRAILSGQQPMMELEEAEKAMRARESTFPPGWSFAPTPP